MFSCIDPKKILNGDEDTTQGLSYLVDIMPTVLTDDDRSTYLREVYSLLADPLLPSIIRKNREGNDIEVSCLDCLLNSDILTVSRWQLLFYQYFIWT